MAHTLQIFRFTIETAFLRLAAGCVGGSEPFAVLEDGTRDGIRLPNAIGTYLHGSFESRDVIEELLGHPVSDSHGGKRLQYDRLADWFAEHVEYDVLLREYLESGV